MLLLPEQSPLSKLMDRWRTEGDILLLCGDDLLLLIENRSRDRFYFGLMMCFGNQMPLPIRPSTLWSKCAAMIKRLVSRGGKDYSPYSISWIASVWEGGYSGVNIAYLKCEVFHWGGYSGLKFQKGAFWRIWTNFMLFLGKFGKMVCWHPPWGVGGLSLGKSWIRHWLHLIFVWILNIYFFNY